MRAERRRIVVENSPGWPYRLVGPFVALAFGKPAGITGALGGSTIQYAARHGPRNIIGHYHGLRILLAGIAMLVLGFLPCAAATLFGLWWTFGRDVTAIDSRRGTVVRWFGLLVPMSWHRRRLAEVKHIDLIAERRGFDHETYRVDLHTRGAGGRGILVREEIDARSSALALARTVGDAIGKPVRNHTSAA